MFVIALLKVLYSQCEIQGGRIMSEFVYLYRGAERGSPEQMQQRMQKWMAWMKELEAKGHIKDRVEEIRAIAGADRLASYPFYYAALGEFEFRAGKPAIAREHFRTALALARNPMERRFLEQRTGACEC
jgi:hypothetical protein